MSKAKVGANNPCLRCIRYPELERTIKINEQLNSVLIDRSARKELQAVLSSNPTEDNFDTEWRMINRDLPFDSDLSTGGSVRDLVKQKLKNIEAEEEEKNKSNNPRK